MSDLSKETPTEAAEARAIRRRWLSIGELVAVTGVLIAALSLWINWSDQRSAEADKSVAAGKAAAARTRLDLRASVIEDGRKVALADPAHEILDTTVTFPKSFGVGDQSPVLPRIDRDWFAAHLLQVTDKGADEREGRLPVLVTVGYRAGDATKKDHAIVELVWRTNGRILAGRELRIEAARIRDRGGDQARIDALWSLELTRLKAS